MGEGYNDAELMAVVISREVRNDEISATGALSPIPAAGLLLARERQAPRAEILILGSPAFMPFQTSRQFHFLAQRGELGLFFVSGIQIDRRGNYNLHMLGSDQERPEQRFPGGYGGGMIYYAARRTILFRTEHSRRTLVEKVDFVSAAGNSPPEVLRYGRPTKLVTPLAILAMHPTEQILKLESCHPPHTPQEVAAHTGFDLGDLSGVATTPAPTEEELAVLRGVVRPRMIESGTYPDWARANIAAQGVA